MNLTSNSKSNSTSNSLFEQFKDTARNELGAMGRTAANSLMGRLPTQNTPGENMGVFPPMSPERMPFGKQIEKRKAPEIMLFSWAERSEAIEVKEQIKALVKQIRQEIGSIEKQNQILVAQAAKLTIEQLPDNPGIYHIRFLEWILRTLRDIRKKVSESSTWFQMLQGKRGKAGYWGKAKKHGTSFTLSGERTAATQTG